LPNSEDDDNNNNNNNNNNNIVLSLKKTPEDGLYIGRNM
jgi:hypothetical protein